LIGRLSDILGRKGAMLLGLSLFGEILVRYIYRASRRTDVLGIGTLLCAVAPTMKALIAARAIVRPKDR